MSEVVYEIKGRGNGSYKRGRCLGGAVAVLLKRRACWGRLRLAWYALSARCSLPEEERKNRQG